MKRFILLLPLAIFAQPADECCYGNPSHAASPGGWGIETALEGLYVQPFEEGLSYAIRSDVRQTTGGADGTPGGPLIDLEPRWQPGVRFSIGYAPSFTARAVWVRFRGETVNHAHATPASGMGLEGTWMPAIDTPVLYGSAAFRWKIDFDTIDFELGKRYDVSPRLTFNPFCAVRYAIIDQAFLASYSQPNDVVSALNDFHGIGPRFGIRTEWGFDRDWCVFAGGSASLLYGPFKTHYGFTSPTIAAEELITSVDERFYRLTSNADFALGLGWNHCWGRWHLGLRLSYEAQIFWDQNELRQPIGSDAPALAILQPGDLSLQGFGLRGEFEF